MNPKHTPTPWKILASMTPDGRVGMRTIEAALNHGQWDVKDFIVRAVNAHEELVKALKAVRISLIDDQYYQEFKPLLKTVDEALAKAEGK